MFDRINPLFDSPLSQISPIILVVIFLWSIVWKGVALWKSARSGKKYWFLAFLIVNSLGILEIVYLVFLQGRIPLKSSKKKVK